MDSSTSLDDMAVRYERQLKYRDQQKASGLSVDLSDVSELGGGDSFSISGSVWDGARTTVRVYQAPSIPELISECKRCGTRPCVHGLALLYFYRDGDWEEQMEPLKVEKASSKAVPSRPAKAMPTDLQLWVEKHWRKSLFAKSHEFLHYVREFYHRKVSGYPSNFYDTDFWRLGWTSPHSQGCPVKLFPQHPKNEVEFWFSLAHLAKSKGWLIPEFLTDLKPSEDFLERQRLESNQYQVEEWQNRLMEASALISVVQSDGPAELRFVLDQDEVLVEFRVGEAEWRSLKSSRFQDFNDRHASFLPQEMSILWNGFFPLTQIHGNSLNRHNPWLFQWLGAQLRHPGLVRHFVCHRLQPLKSHDQALIWRLQEPGEDRKEYQLALVTPDQQIVRNVKYKFPGNPPLYMTEYGLFPGPRVLPQHVLPSEPTAIPVEVVESGVGIQLLELIQLEPPPRLATKIRTEPLTVTLKANIPKSKGVNDYCHLQARAETVHRGYPHHLEGMGWKQKQKNPPSELVRLDRTPLEGIHNLIEAAGFKYDFYASCFTARITKNFPEHFRTLLDQLPSHVQIELEGELKSLKEGQVSGTLSLQAAEADNDWFDLQVVVQVSDTTLTPEEIRVLIQAKGAWVRIEKRGWRRLEYQLTEREESDLAKIGLTPRQLSAEPQRLHALQLADPASRRFLSEETANSIDLKVAQLKTRVAPAQPVEIHAQLRPYQLEGFHFLAYLSVNGFGGILADDMGLGKTLQTLTWLAWLRTQGALASRRLLPSLVVCPKSVQDNWQAECHRFYSGLRVKVWSGTSMEELNTAFSAADLHVLNYSQLRLAEDVLCRTEFLAVILDEGQNIKNPSSQTTQVARRLRADYRLVLTGTPIENRLLDLWSLMSFAMPGVLGSRAGFGKLYDGKDDPFARSRLSARVRPFLLRRTKSQVARDLPDRVEEDLYCEMEGEQRTLYRAELKSAQQFLLKIKTQKALNKDRFHFLTSLLRLRQICCHPRLVKPDAKQEGAKLEALIETLEPLIEEGEKVLVFSQFSTLLDLIQPAIRARGWSQWYLAGDTEDRGALVKEFQEHAGGGVFLISLKAGGAGLNLTAASYVVLFDPWWNPAVENQAIDRTHRIGQTRKIMAYRLLIKGSIEEKIRKLQKTKSALAEEVLGEERFSSALTLDDLKFLLSD